MGGSGMRPNRPLLGGWEGLAAVCMLLLAVCMLLGRSLFLMHFCAATSRILHVVGRSLHVAYMLLLQFAEGGRGLTGPLWAGSLPVRGEASQAHSA